MGTFPRLNAGPVSSAMILLGKLISVFVICGLQFGLLLLAGRFLFAVQWGDPVAVVVLAVVTVLAFTGLGLLIATFARDQSQANTLATTIDLIFSLIGGSLLPLAIFPVWTQRIAQFTPNYWGMAGFTKLAIGEGLAALTTEIGALTLRSPSSYLAQVWCFTSGGCCVSYSPYAAPDETPEVETLSACQSPVEACVRSAS